MRKRRKAALAAMGKKLVSALCVAAVSLLAVGFMPAEEVPEAPPPVTEEAEDEHRGLGDGPIDPITPELEAVLLDFARAAGGEDREAFARELPARLEALAKFDLKHYPGAETVYRLYSAAVKANERLAAVSVFEDNMETLSSVFTELDRIREGCVFTRAAEYELSESVKGAAEYIRPWLLTGDGMLLSETLIYKNADSILSASLAAADFLKGRMDALSGEVGMEQYIVYRYALGGGWEKNNRPPELFDGAPEVLCELVKDAVLDELYESGFTR